MGAEDWGGARIENVGAQPTLICIRTIQYVEDITKIAEISGIVAETKGVEVAQEWIEELVTKSSNVVERSNNNIVIKQSFHNICK